MGIMTSGKGVDKITVFYINKVDQDGNRYRFYTVGELVSDIEYFRIEETGNLKVLMGTNFQIKIVPNNIERIPVSSYRELVGLWNRKTDKKGWYILYNDVKYQPDICIIQKNGHDVNGNAKFKLYLTKRGRNVTKFFRYWRLVNGDYMSVIGYVSQIKEIIKERFNDICIIEI